MPGRKGLRSRDYSYYRWSKELLTIKEIVERFRQHAPFLFYVMEGYDGRDSSTHTISADEMYWFVKIVSKERIVVKDYLGQFISIPVSNDRRVIPTTYDGKVGPEMTIGELVACGEGSQRASPSYASFHFADDLSQSVYAGAADSTSYQLGELTIEAQYQEKFLAAYSTVAGNAVEHLPTGRTVVHKGPLHPKLQLIPVYMPITVHIAVGIRGRSYRTFIKDMLDYKTKADALDLDQKVPEALQRDEVSKLMVFDEHPEDEYDYISAVTLECAFDERKDGRRPSAPGPRVGDTSSTYGYTTVYYDSGMNLELLLSDVQDVFMSGKVPDGESSDEEEEEKVQVATEPTPPRPPRVNRTQSNPLQTPPTPDGDSSMSRPPKVTRTLSLSSEGATRRLRSNPQPSEPPPARPQRQSSYGNLQSRRSQKIDWMPMYEGSSIRGSSATSHSSASVIRDVADIPANTSELTSEQLADSLRLLGLEDCVQNLASVDGTKLMDMDEVAIRDMSGLVGLKAKKLLQFIMGWRPNTGS